MDIMYYLIRDKYGHLYLAQELDPSYQVLYRTTNEAIGRELLKICSTNSIVAIALESTYVPEGVKYA